MASRSEELIQNIHDYSLEEIMGERFKKYSKYIIQDRAIPDVRDGLKPVQRRILYTMYKEKNTYDKPHRKSAKAVGDIMGHYHPHGDTSIYDAMVRMSQWWKQSTPYIDMQGNNGSMDGDPAAAMRYTEARLSKISNELLKDIDKNTIVWAPNFDDTELEPTVLPAKFPNLLVNGSAGISAGYATNIPPHNLEEVIDATIYRIDNPNSRLDTIMNIVKGPDFPTGGIIEGIDGIKSAYETGKGKIIIKAKTKLEKNKIIISEIPFEVNKQNLVKKIDEIRIDKKIDGIVEARDESDKNGIQLCIDVKKEANPELILNYLFKNTDLQISYAINMIAIVRRRPMQLGILGILDAYIDHQKEVMYNMCEFSLKRAQTEFHLCEGLIRAISILDDVIKTIRASKDKGDARENLMIKFGFSEEQAEHILTLQLYRLSNTDIIALQEKLENLTAIINKLNKILNDPAELRNAIKDELRKIKREYRTDRKSEIKEEISSIVIDSNLMLPKEDVVVVISKEGYIKRVSTRSYASSNNEETTLKENDYIIGLYNINTLDTILIFTDHGNYLYIPVHEIPELKWKELGKHISNVIELNSEEKVIGAIPVHDFNENKYITSFSKNGLIKRTKLSEFKVQRYSKAMSMMNLKENDTLVSVTDNYNNNVLAVTKNGYSLWYDINEVSDIGLKAAGVKSINLKNDEVVSSILFNEEDEYIAIVTDKGTAKRLKLTEIEKGRRGNRGTLLMKQIKANPSQVCKVFVMNSKNNIGIITDRDKKVIKLTEIPIMDKQSNGSYIVRNRIIDVYEIMNLFSINNNKKIEEEEPEEIIAPKIVEKKKEPISLKEVDERIMTIDDLLDNIENTN